MTGKHVPASAVDERERELLDAVRGARLPAEELFGDAADLAAEDVAELATTEEAVLTSQGGGLRPALIEVGGTLLGIGAVAAVLTAVRSGWSVDIGVAHSLVAVGVLIAFLGWVVGRAVFAGGRSATTVGVLVATGAVAVACIATAASVGLDRVIAHDVSVPLLALGLLLPGIAVLVGGSRMPRQGLRESWPDAEWLRRFRGGLRAGLVPAATARGHVAEVEQVLPSAGSSAASEFGHPLVLAREIAQGNRVARTRRWWLSTGTGTGTPLVIAALVLANGSWDALTIPVAVILLLSALITPVVGWQDRPWANAR
ncbi:hypothetical protein [Brevibacterium sp. FME17]|uniref:hypothetical protein n=1 Tax=Brevibacterium sp. FME17 TaxID=2742606 RepID=UPI001D0258A6|nr:hypothetical protein [Brevibacterium sp. FME17]